MFYKDIAIAPWPIEGHRGHRSRNRGGRPPQYINPGGPGPPNVGAIKGILTVKMDFLIHINIPAIFATIFRLKHKF